MGTSRYFSLKNLPEISSDIEQRYTRVQKLYQQLLDGTPQVYVLTVTTFHCLQNLHKYEIDVTVPMFERGLDSLKKSVRITQVQHQEINTAKALLADYQKLVKKLIPLLAQAYEETTEKLLQKTQYDTELDQLSWATPLPDSVQKALATRINDTQALKLAKTTDQE
ncbi:hypothetical protein A6770_35525 [Nostoc minutum NIES-26]|uniref:Dynamin family protein n=1 Tax=Nostoc minutum NIES-26 TaxID=1844469 RepID=A0A367S1A6_9NOSO|nr:hypothetical protein A6770_35525 [Nostoc minutum NIES-26]